MELKHLFVTLLLHILVVSSLETKVTNLCESSTKTSKTTCECLTENSEKDLLMVRIDCSSKGFNSLIFEAEILPTFTEELNLSWNYFENIPDLVSKTLKRLRLAHNKIQSTDDKNFIYTTNLTELDMSWNGLELLSINTFSGLEYLQKLDLSGNNLKRINLNMFSSLISLEVLDLSWNSGLNESIDIKDLDFFLAYGLTPKLKILKMGHCNLNQIHLDHAVELQELHLGWNNLEKLPDLPRNLKFIDLSGNPIVIFKQSLLPHLLQLRVLLLEDMPVLSEIDEYAFFGLPNLKTLSFQNSRVLTVIHPHVFGETIKISNETDKFLERLNLRGTKLKRLNSTLAIPFEHLKFLDLTGLQLICDCNLKWIHNLQIETGGRCNDPVALQGLKLSELEDSQFACNNMPSWVAQLFNGLLILLLIVLCSVGIWLIVMGLRPSHKKETPKLGNTSPYARITIEPNQGENYY